MSNPVQEEFLDAPVLLSPQGRARREQILAAGLAAAARRARRRSAVQLAGTVGTLALCIGAAWIGVRVRSGSSGMHDHTHHLTQSDSTFVQPIQVPAPAPKSMPTATTDNGIERIDDQQLLALLAQSGGSYGLVRIDGRVDLVRNDPAR